MDGKDDLVNSAPLDLDVLWTEALGLLEGTIVSPPQRQWLHATRPVGFANDTVILASPNEFVRSWLDRECSESITKALSRVAGRDLTMMLTIQPNPQPMAAPGSLVPDSAAVERPDHVRLPGHLKLPHTSVVERHPWPQEDVARQPARTIPGDAGHPAAARWEQAPNVTVAPTDQQPAPGPQGFAPTDTSLDPAGPAQLHRDGLSQGNWTEAVTASHHAIAEPLGATEAWPSFGADAPTVGTSTRALDAPGRPAGEHVQLPPRRQPDPEVEPDTQLNPKYVFDNFVIGASNRFAHAAAFAVAETPAKAYNPLFIYGGSGLGKTHLLHAIGHYVRSLYPRLRVRYVTTEQFTNEFITAIKNTQMAEFQRLYRQTDILLVDDIQFLSERERTQEEFFHTFNALHMAEKQIVLSSDRPPRQIARLEERLRNRFEWGLMTDVTPPDLETRIAILRRKTAAERIDVDDDVLEFIASRVQSNIRELEGALIRVTAFGSLQRRPADRTMAEEVLKDLFPGDHERQISVHLIMDEVSQFFDFTVEELCSKSRTRKLSTARQIAMYLTRELTEMSLPKIGGAFGGRDHSTVLHANNKIADLMGERQQIYNQVQELTNRVKTRARSI